MMLEKKMKAMKMLAADRRFKRAKDYFMPVIFSSLVVSLAWWGAGGMRHQTEKPIDAPRYLTARTFREAGQILQFEDLEVLSSAEGGKISPAHFTDQDLSLIRGARVRSRLEVGQPIPFSALELTPAAGERKPKKRVRVPPGLRAYPIRFNSELELHPGDRIDLFMNPTDRGARPALLLEAVLVLQAKSVETAVSDVVVALNREGITVVEGARLTGSLSAALRNPDEPWAERRSRPKKITRKIELISEEP